MVIFLLKFYLSTQFMAFTLFRFDIWVIEKTSFLSSEWKYPFPENKKDAEASFLMYRVSKLSISR